MPASRLLCSAELPASAHFLPYGYFKLIKRFKIPIHNFQVGGSALTSLAPTPVWDMNPGPRACYESLLLNCSPSAENILALITLPGCVSWVL